MKNSKINHNGDDNNDDDCHQTSQISYIYFKYQWNYTFRTDYSKPVWDDPVWKDTLSGSPNLWKFLCKLNLSGMIICQERPLFLDIKGGCTRQISLFMNPNHLKTKRIVFTHTPPRQSDKSEFWLLEVRCL